MMSKTAALTLVAAILMAQGCATTHYGRQLPLAEGSKQVMGCKDIDAEIARVNEFIDQVKKDNPETSLVFMDFGVGNSREKKEALESADRRLAQLAELKKEKKCDASR